MKLDFISIWEEISNNWSCLRGSRLVSECSFPDRSFVEGTHASTASELENVKKILEKYIGEKVMIRV